MKIHYTSKKREIAAEKLSRERKGKYSKGHKFQKGHGKLRNNYQKGIHYSPETEFKKGHKPVFTPFQKGYTPWNKGLKGVMKAWNKGKSVPQIGRENHWNWKGGITKFTERIRKCFKYRQWRLDVFTRDDFTCQKCGARSGGGKAVYLEADHYPKRFTDIIKENNIKTVQGALECKELWDTNSGRTLCKHCHKIYTDFAKKTVLGK